MQTVTVTPKAAKHIQRLMDKDGLEDHGLRVAVKGGGCSGLSYVLGFDDAPKTDEKEVTEQHGVKVFVDLKSALFIAGMTLDFSDGLNGKGFTFENPVAKTTCGCGTSFAA